MRIIITALLIPLSFTVFGQDKFQIPKELELILSYAQKSDYPEVYNDNPYQIRPISWQIIDIDSDGVTEVFLQSFPHYRQSPTITIYQIDSNDSVSRVTEGLAPGPLIPLNPEDDYFDPHSTGTAVDMQVNNADNEKMRALAKSSLKFGMSPVLYKNFMHTDKRDGKPIFLDLSYLNFKDDNSCKNFQFSMPSAIVAGNVQGKNEKCFLALVGDDIYCYSIKGFTADGWIEKELITIRKPTDFKSFVLDNGKIKYLTQKGRKEKLKI